MKNVIRKTVMMIALCCFITSNTYAYTPEKKALRDSILSVITGAKDYSSQQTMAITKFGARPDGKSDCLPAFRKAMKKAQKTKGGLHIVVPKGNYFVRGPIHLVSNVTLDIQEGATLLFSPNPDDYLPVVKTSWEGSFCYNHSPMIYGYGLTNVSIIGRGTIDGNCPETFPEWRKNQKTDQMLSREYNHNNVKHEDRVFGKGHRLRPHLLQLYECKDITIEDVFITNSPFWCIHLLKCENAICRGIRYDAKLVNNDGIDPEMSRNMLMENITFNNGDDNFAIKAGRDNDGWAGTPTENIIIRNCSFKGLHAVVIGSEMSAGVSKVFVEDCTFGGYVKRGLYIKTNPNRGGTVNNIYMTNCKFGEVEDLVYVTSMYAGEGADDNHFTDIYDIHVENVTAQKASNAAIVLQGTVAKPLRNITFKDVTVDECRVGFSSANTETIGLINCNLGGTVDSAPSQAAHKDNLWR